MSMKLMLIRTQYFISLVQSNFSPLHTQELKEQINQVFSDKNQHKYGWLVYLF